MKLNFVKLNMLIAGLVCFAAFGCKGNNGRPTVLHYAFAPSTEQLQSSSVRTDLLMKYLSAQVHIPVEVVRVEGYAPTIEAMRAKKVDIATYGSLGYIIAAQKAGAEAIVSRGEADGSLGSYRSVIAVPKDSPYHSLADLKAHAKNIVFAFADPASTSGNLYPRVGLLDAGIDAEKDFNKVVYANGHLAAFMAVKSDKVDAAGFMQAMITRMLQQKKMQPGDVRVIWTSDPIPDGPTAVRSDLPADIKKAIQDALVNMPQRDPELWANITSTYKNFGVAGMKYIPVNDAYYDGLRKYTSRVKDFKFVDK